MHVSVAQKRSKARRARYRGARPLREFRREHLGLSSPHQQCRCLDPSEQLPFPRTVPTSNAPEEQSVEVVPPRVAAVGLAGKIASREHDAEEPSAPATATSFE
jgi:hypothetical protein